MRPGVSVSVSVCVAALLAAGCAHHPETLPRLPHQIYKITDGKPARSSDADLDRALLASHAVYAGEQHTDPHHHAFELELLERLHRLDPSLALGLEMLPASSQPALDDFVAGRTDERAFLAAVDWQHAWGYPFSYYRPLLLFCRAHRLRAVALNAPNALARKLAHGGLEALTDEERRALPALSPGPPAHRKQLEEAMAEHHGAGIDTGMLEHFYLAQLLWDHTMADNVSRTLERAGAPRRILVVAGEGHAKKFAVPVRAEAHGAGPSLTILPRYRLDPDEKLDGEADFLWILAR